MNWQDMYEVSLERIKQLNKEVELLQAILHSYLPIVDIKNIERNQNEKR